MIFYAIEFITILIHVQNNIYKIRTVISKELKYVQCLIIIYCFSTLHLEEMSKLGNLGNLFCSF